MRLLDVPIESKKCNCLVLQERQCAVVRSGRSVVEKIKAFIVE